MQKVTRPVMSQRPTVPPAAPHSSDGITHNANGTYTGPNGQVLAGNSLGQARQSMQHPMQSAMQPQHTAIGTMPSQQSMMQMQQAPTSVASSMPPQSNMYGQPPQSNMYSQASQGSSQYMNPSQAMNFNPGGSPYGVPTQPMSGYGAPQSVDVGQVFGQLGAQQPSAQNGQFQGNSYPPMS